MIVITSDGGFLQDQQMRAMGWAVFALSSCSELTAIKYSTTLAEVACPFNVERLALSCAATDAEFRDDPEWKRKRDLGVEHVLPAKDIGKKQADRVQDILVNAKGPRFSPKPR